jgi:hypothetical protein
LGPSNRRCFQSYSENEFFDLSYPLLRYRAGSKEYHDLAGSV